MSFFNKILNTINNIDDEDYDDEYDEYQDEPLDDFEDKKSNKVNLFNNRTKKSRYDDRYESYDEPTTNSGLGMGVCVIKPTKVEDGRSICETVKNNKTVILNVEGLDLEIAQRIIDFTSGATFALNGNLEKISNSIFLITPDNVNISGDLQDILNGGFDMSGIRNRF